MKKCIVTRTLLGSFDKGSIIIDQFGWLSCKLRFPLLMPPAQKYNNDPYKVAYNHCQPWGFHKDKTSSGSSSCWFGSFIFLCPSTPGHKNKHGQVAYHRCQPWSFQIKASSARCLYQPSGYPLPIHEVPSQLCHIEGERIIVHYTITGVKSRPMQQLEKILKEVLDSALLWTQMTCLPIWQPKTSQHFKCEKSDNSEESVQQIFDWIWK